jgi:hypothetical protein
MITLRVEWKRGGQLEHSMHECKEYQVQNRGGRTIITLDQGTGEPTELTLDGSQTVYAMNEHGKTIDKIKPERTERRS